MFFLPAAAAAQSPLESPFGNLPTATKREAAALREAFADGADAAKILKEAVADGRDGAAVTFNLGNALFRNGDYAGAAKAYSAALSKIPNFFAARKNLAYSLDRLGDGERARENFAKALALSGGSDADILLWLASHYSGKSDWSSALSCVDAALVHAPERAGAEYAKAFYLFNLGRHAEAAKTCERILAKNFPDAAALKLLGKCRAKSGDLPGAIAALSMVPQDDPDFRSAEILRADIFFSARAYAEAAKIYESLGEDGRLGAAAEALARAGEFEKALGVLAKLPDSAGKFRSQARAHIGLGDAEGAKKSLSACLAEEPDDPYACFEFAKLSFAGGDYNLAKILYNRAQKDETYSVAAKVGLMSVAVKTGALGEAVSIASSLYAQTRRAEVGEYLEYLKNAKKAEDM